MIVEPSVAAFDILDILRDEQRCWHLIEQGYCVLGIYDPSRAELASNVPSEGGLQTVIYKRDFRDKRAAEEFVLLHSIQKALDKFKGAE